MEYQHPDLWEEQESGSALPQKMFKDQHPDLWQEQELGSALEGIVVDWDTFSSSALAERDELINNGIEECRDLLGKQKSKNMYYLYEGSIEGFEECRTLSTPEAYENRLRELREEEIREISLSSLKGDDEETQRLREGMKIYDPNEKTDDKKLWKIKGRLSQINYIYERLKGYMVAAAILEKQIKDVSKLN